jgi:hypothetical protein
MESFLPVSEARLANRPAFSIAPISARTWLIKGEVEKGFVHNR